MHTRLPAYTRGREGVVESIFGPAIFPDASAAGITRKENRYTVCFDAAEIWPEDEKQNAWIYIDMWESCLEPA